MKIIRTPSANHFTHLSNDMLRDSRLSYKARGLLAYLLSMPDGWSTSADRLAKAGPDGRDAVLSGLRELEESGYLKRTRSQDSQGRWTTECEIFDTPTEVGFSDFGSPEFGSPDSIKKDPEEELKTPPVPPVQETLYAGINADGEEVILPSREPELGSDDDPGFVAFWNAYPRKAAKGQARKAWRAARRKGVSAGEIITGAEHYRDDRHRRSRPMEYTAHPATWLNGERWLEAHQVIPMYQERPSNNPFEN